MTAPLYAAVLSITVACIPPLQSGLQTHVQSVMQAISMAGDSSVPLTLVVLGAYFYPEPRRNDDDRPQGEEMIEPTASSKALVRKMARGARKLLRKRPSPVPGERKTVVLSILCRMLVGPVLILPVIAVATMKDWHVTFKEYALFCYGRSAVYLLLTCSPVFVLAMVIQVTSPPALTLAQVCLTDVH